VATADSVPGVVREIFALLTVHQALVPIAGDVTTATAGLSVQRVSFTVLFQAAADQITVARELPRTVRCRWSGPSAGACWQGSSPNGIPSV
jgi:hypothetical protein